MRVETYSMKLNTYAEGGEWCSVEDVVELILEHEKEVSDLEKRIEDLITADPVENKG